VEIFVQALAGVFFEMGAHKTHGFFLLADADRHVTAGDDGRFILADLIAFWQVGIKVVLAREDRAGRDLAADREPELDRADHRFAIQHRQHAGQRDIDGAGLAVGLRPEGGRGAGKDLRFRQQLDMGFQPDHDFPAHYIPSGMRRCQSVAC
jgi:hypothetical protein